MDLDLCVVVCVYLIENSQQMQTDSNKGRPTRTIVISLNRMFGNAKATSANYFRNQTVGRCLNLGGIAFPNDLY